MRRKKTFTKAAVKALLIIGVIDANIPFLLAFLNKDPCREIGLAFITEIVAVILGYMLKSYFETKQEKRQELAEYTAGMRGEE
jgi:uncharacterized protein YacL